MIVGSKIFTSTPDSTTSILFGPLSAPAEVIVRVLIPNSGPGFISISSGVDITTSSVNQCFVITSGSDVKLHMNQGESLYGTVDVSNSAGMGLGGGSNVISWVVNYI